MLQNLIKMKNAWPILFVIILLPTIYASQSIREFDYNMPITVTEAVQNTTGEPCLLCTCNLTVYYPNGTINSSYVLNNLGGGIYNTTVNPLDINLENEAYPVILRCNSTNHFGISDFNAIRVVPRMFDFTGLAILILGISVIFAYIGIGLEPSDPIKVWMKWAFILLAIFNLFGGGLFAILVSGYSGVDGLPEYFEAIMYGVMIVFILAVFALIYYFIFTKGINSISSDK